MMETNFMILRTREFTLGCFRFAAGIPENYLSRHIRDQLIRSSSSVSANYRAARRAQTTKGFVFKLSIVIEEADEVQHWLEILIDSGILQKSPEWETLWKESDELIAILIATRKKLRANQTHQT